MAHWTLLRFSFEWESYTGCCSYRGGQPKLQWFKSIKNYSQIISQNQATPSLYGLLVYFFLL